MDKFKTKIQAITKKKLKTVQKQPQKLRAPRLVVCAGMHRSGSTFTYNICHALGYNPMGYTGSVSIRNCINKAGVLKVHFLNYHKSVQHKDIKIITSYRDVRDVYMSLILKGDHFDNPIIPGKHISSGIMDKIHQNITSLKSLIGQKNVMVLKYERDIIPSETKIIHTIAKFLNIQEYDVDKVIDMVGIEKMKKLQDIGESNRPSFCNGLLSEKHISKTNGNPGTHMALDIDTLNMLNEEFGDYLKEFGYIKDKS